MEANADMLIETESGKIGEALAVLRAMDGLIAADAVTGPYDIVATAQPPDPHAISRMVMSEIHAVSEIKRAITCMAIGYAARAGNAASKRHVAAARPFSGEPPALGDARRAYPGVLGGAFTIVIGLFTDQLAPDVGIGHWLRVIVPAVVVWTLEALPCGAAPGFFASLIRRAQE